MRVNLFAASLLLTSAVAVAHLGVLASPARADAAPASEFRCKCPQAQPRKVSSRPRPVARSAVQGYDYGSAYAVNQGGWHGEWRVARNDGYVAPMPGYGGGYEESYYGEPVQLDRDGWSGGVGMGYGDGGGGGGGADGFGQLHFGLGGSAENGPTYNSYNQSFQYNPSQAGPFQNRLMGGLAPVKK